METENVMMEEPGMSRSYRVVALATASLAALLTASVFLWLSARTNAAETSDDGIQIVDKDVRVIEVSDDGTTQVVVGDPGKNTKVVVVRKGGDGAEGSAFLGVQLSEETKYKDGGARVDEVVADSPAEKAGLKEKDIIVSFGGQSIHGPMRLTESIHAAKPGDRVQIEIVRDGARQKLEVELGERPKSFAYWFGDDGKGFTPLPEGGEWQSLEGLKGLESLKHLEGLQNIPGVMQWRMFGSRPKLGIRVVETTPELREHLGGNKTSGVLVGKVIAGMPAEKAGLKVGDIIVSIDGVDVGSAGSLVEALSDKDGKTVDVEVIRDRKPMRFKAVIPEASDEEDDSGPQAYYFRTPPAPPAPPAPAAPPAPPAPFGAPPAMAPPTPAAPPAPPRGHDVVEAMRLAELAALRHRTDAERMAMDAARQQLVAAQLLVERELARSYADADRAVARRIQEELAAAATDSAEARAEIAREIESQARAGVLDHAQQELERAREELHRSLEGAEIY
jgi:membrane-associated protease RseP (regulator of RpoE activity)